MILFCSDKFWFYEQKMANLCEKIYDECYSFIYE